jgi:hypothetical protein
MNLRHQVVFWLILVGSGAFSETTIMKRQAKSIRSRTDPPADLTGKRFGKWTVMKYARQKAYYCGGRRFSKRMWLCRCDCGVQKEVEHHNLTEGLSKKCQQCRCTSHGMYSTRIYGVWRNLKQSDKLPKKWLDFDAFREAVADPPDKKARLTRYDRTKPYSSRNTFWMYSGLLQTDSALLDRLKKIRKKSSEERVAHDKMLMRIRKAKSQDERNRRMIAARKAGYSLELIGMAAHLTRQRAHVIVTSRGR